MYSVGEITGVRQSGKWKEVSSVKEIEILYTFRWNKQKTILDVFMLCAEEETCSILQCVIKSKSLKSNV